MFKCRRRYRITRFLYKCWSSKAEGKRWKSTVQMFSSRKPAKGECKKQKNPKANKQIKNITKYLCDLLGKHKTWLWQWEQRLSSPSFLLILMTKQTNKQTSFPWTLRSCHGHDLTVCSEHKVDRQHLWWRQGCASPAALSLLILRRKGTCSCRNVMPWSQHQRSKQTNASNPLHTPDPFQEPSRAW